MENKITANAQATLAAYAKVYNLKLNCRASDHLRGIDTDATAKSRHAQSVLEHAALTAKLLEFVYPELAKQNSWKLPVWYYITKSTKRNELAEEKAPKQYGEIVTDSAIQRNRSAIAGRTAWQIWTEEKENLLKAIRLLGYLPENQVNVEQYRQILGAIFDENVNILSSLDSPNRSNLHRMIRIYDFLKYRQKKTP